MSTGTEGAPPGPWRAPTSPPVVYLPAEDSAWAEALPDPSIDPEPTGELPVVSPALPTPVRLRRGRQRVAVLGAIVVPSILFVFGALMIAWGFGSSDRRDTSAGSFTPSESAAPTNSDVPTLATAAVAVQGDPAVAATDLAAVFVTQLRTGQFDAAAALTHGERTAQELRAGYSTVAVLQHAIARISPTGPDAYAVRVVFVQEPTDPAGIAVGRCEQWEVSPSGQAVIPGEDTPGIKDPLKGLLRGQELMSEMAHICASMSIG